MSLSQEQLDDRMRIKLEEFFGKKKKLTGIRVAGENWRILVGEDVLSTAVLTAWTDRGWVTFKEIRHPISLAHFQTRQEKLAKPAATYQIYLETLGSTELKKSKT